MRPIFALIANFFKLLKYIWSTFWFKLQGLFMGDQPVYVEVSLEDSYPFGPPKGLASLFQQTPTFIGLRSKLKKIEKEPTIDGLVIETEGLQLAAGQLDEIIELIEDLRESGKHVVGHSRTPQTSDYLVLSACDDVAVSPGSRLYTFGPRIDQYFGLRALERLGVKPQFIRIGAFKTATNRFTQSEMPDAQRAMLGAMYDSLKDLHLEQIASGREMSTDRASQLFEQAPLTPFSAQNQDFVDGAVFRSRLAEWIQEPDLTPQLGRTARSNATHEGEFGQSELPSLIEAGEYVDSLPSSFEWTPLFSTPPRLAVVDLTGMIVTEGMAAPSASMPRIDPGEVLPVLEQIRDDPRYVGLLTHINSPGGSATASDVLWEALVDVGRYKPVVSYCSSVAASGGYYLAVASDDIVTHRYTMTGSIGVITGQFSVEAIPDKLGIGHESIFDTEADTFTSPLHSLSDAMLERLKSDARTFYSRFLDRVGQARQLPRRRLHRYGRGRVYTGVQAKKRDLVDRIGSMTDAVETLAGRCGVDPASTPLDFHPHRQTSLGDLLQGSYETTVEKWLQKTEKPMAIYQLLAEDPVLALMPWRVAETQKPGRH